MSMEPIKLNYTVDQNISTAGHASSQMKMNLRKLGIPSEIIRKASICMYEGEINMVIHANGGMAEVIITLDDITIRLIDTGPGIPDVEKARQPMFTTGFIEFASPMTRLAMPTTRSVPEIRFRCSSRESRSEKMSKGPSSVFRRK